MHVYLWLFQKFKSLTPDIVIPKNKKNIVQIQYKEIKICKYLINCN